MAQANSETPRGKGEQGDKALAGNEAAKQDGQAVPGAVVAVIFGIFGILVVARRRLR